MPICSVAFDWLLVQSLKSRSEATLEVTFEGTFEFSFDVRRMEDNLSREINLPGSKFPLIFRKILVPV